ncbi:MAG: hypothetical protein K0S33_1849 [Bacteroidetes bacterium]|jgi:hypothetical protein|nr:hypothetical protein [Bacteroidota bacterium]
MYSTKHIILLVFLLIGIHSVAQPPSNIGGSDTVKNTSIYDATMKDAVKQSDLPEINDTVGKLKDKQLGIQPKPVETSYKAPPIKAAKMVNEPLSKLYYSQLKAGFGNYTMPYGEIWLNNLRSKEYVYGFHYKHLSARYTAEDRGFAGWSDNDVNLYAKKFYKKHVLSGDLNYYRNVSQFYGYPDSLVEKNDVTNNFARQRFHTFEGKLNLKSFYTDSSSINHDIHLNYYNIRDKFETAENNIFADGLIKTYVNKERLNVLISADYYNTKSKTDTVNDFIFRLTPYFQAGGEKWNVDLGLNVAIDEMTDVSTKFYFYPKLGIHYNIYNNFVIPYAGVTGGLEKNSFRSFTTTNPFIISNPAYLNTNNVYNLFGGLRGVLSSKTSYDAKATYSKYKNMPFFLINYDDFLSNKFTVLYNDVTLLNVNGQIKYQLKEKVNVIAKGNYYGYSGLDSGAYAWHKPDFDVTLSATYNLKSKIIIKADLFYIGKQWARQLETSSLGVQTVNNVQLKGIADINLGAEYRYSKMLSFFATFNNIGNVRYYRWDRYPTQRFNAMIGVTFVPF